MVKSTVVDEKTGGSKDSRVRTSSGIFLKRGHDEVVERIEQGISDFTFIPAENGQGIQVLHYQVGQKYEPHYDYFLDKFNTKSGGHRIATVLMYLSDRMLMMVERPYSQQQKETLVQSHGVTSSRNVAKKDSLFYQRSEMLYCSGT